MIEKIKNLLVNPKSEFGKYDKEEAPAMMNTFTSFAVLLFIIPAVFTIIGWGVIGYRIGFAGFGHTFTSWEVGIKAGIIILVACIAAFFASTYIIDALAPSFGSTKNLNRSAQLVAASLAPGAIAGVFCLFPNMASLMILGALYGGYILFVGLPYSMKAPKDQAPIYAIVAVLVIIVSFFLVNYILSQILLNYGAGFGRF